MITRAIKKYKNATNKLLLLDYDGTLVDLASTPEKAKPSEHLLNILIKLIKKSHTEVIIISGRGYQDIDKLLGHLPIKIIAEHGAMIKENGEWAKQIVENVFWKNKTFPILNKITLSCPKSFIEEKHFSLAWHYRNAELKSGEIHSRELIRVLESIIPSHNIKILDGNKVVEVMTKEIGKGKAVKNLIEQTKYDSILSIGDDKTDEEMFEVLLHNTNAATVKVGNGKTFAKYKLDDVSNVISLLEELSQ